MSDILHIRITYNAIEIRNMENSIKSSFTRENIIQNAPEKNFLPIMEVTIPQNIPIKEEERELGMNL